MQEQDQRFRGEVIGLAVKSAVVAVVALVAGSVVVHSESNWPGWRGPARSGLVDGAPWPESLGKEVLVKRWHVDVAEGYPGPIVFEDRVFTVETSDERAEVVRAFDRESGELIWARSWEGAMKVPFFAARNGSWVRSTPATDGKVLLVGGMREVLVALDLQTGDERWRIDFVEAFDGQLPSFGFASSPLIVGEAAFVQAGGGVVKLKVESGEVVWRRRTGGGGMSGGAFSSPILTEVNGKQQLIVQGREKLMGIDPKTGERLWDQAVKAFRGMNIVTPVPYKNGFFTTTYGGRSRLWTIERRGTAIEVGNPWDNKLQGYMCTPVVVGDHAYFHLRNQRAACVDLATGEIAWVSDERFGKYWSMVAQGDRILALDEQGELILFKANPEKFEMVDRREVSSSETWGHLTVVDGEIYVRELRGLSSWSWKGATELAQGNR